MLRYTERMMKAAVAEHSILSAHGTLSLLIRV